MSRRALCLAAALAVSTPATAQTRIAPPVASARDRASPPQTCGSRDPRRFPQDCRSEPAPSAAVIELEARAPVRQTPRSSLNETGTVVAPSFAPNRAPVSSSDWRIVQASSLNCRLAPSIDTRHLETLDHNDSVEVITTQADWSLVRRRTNCWVSSAYLGADRVPETEVQETAAPSRPLRARPTLRFGRQLRAARLPPITPTVPLRVPPAPRRSGVVNQAMRPTSIVKRCTAASALSWKPVAFRKNADASCRSVLSALRCVHRLMAEPSEVSGPARPERPFRTPDHPLQEPASAPPLQD